MTSISEAIIEFRRKYPYDAWDIFWDYKSSIEGDGGDICSEDNLLITTGHLMSYLYRYKMTRNNKLGSLSEREFSQILSNSSESLRLLSGIRFSTLTAEDQHNIREAYRGLGEELGNYRISPTETMITKILMALWGETPAFDYRAVNTYRKVIGKKPGDYFKSLWKLKLKYESDWKDQIDNLPLTYKQTLKGTAVPHAKLIDMAFWLMG